MTRFIDIKHSTHHHGADRVESVIDAVQQLRRDFFGARGLATLLSSALAAAIVVVAYQLMDTLAEGHLLLLWTGLWAVAFVALAFFARATRHLVIRLKSGLDGWSHAIARARADQRLWAIAQTDARVMADLQLAITRKEATTGALPASPVRAGQATPAVPLTAFMASPFTRDYI